MGLLTSVLAVSCVRACDCMLHSFQPCLECVLGGHAVDQTPQLFDHSLYELLFVSVILPKLREDVVFLIGVFHLLQQGQGSGWVYSQVFGSWLAIVSQIRRPVPHHEQVQELS